MDSVEARRTMNSSFLAVQKLSDSSMSHHRVIETIVDRWVNREKFHKKILNFQVFVFTKNSTKKWNCKIKIKIYYENFWEFRFFPIFSRKFVEVQSSCLSLYRTVYVKFHTKLSSFLSRSQILFSRISVKMNFALFRI